MSEDRLTEIAADFRGFEIATDSSLMRQYLQRGLQAAWKLPVRVKDLWIPRVFPRGEGGFAIQFNLTVEGQGANLQRRQILYGRLLGSAEDWPSYADRAGNEVIVLENLRFVMPIFPFDPELSQLSEFWNPTRAMTTLNRYLAKRFSDRGAVAIGGRDLLGYRLERRCVIRYTLKSPIQQSDGAGFEKVVVKLLRPRAACKAARLACELEAGGFHALAQDGLTVPRIYGSDDERGFLVMEAAGGKSLHDLLGNSQFVEGCASAARMLKKLHSLPTSGEPVYSASHELESLRKLTAIVARVFPRSADSFRDLYQSLGEHHSFPPEKVPAVRVHRDFYDKQVLYSKKRTTLLDCESMTISDPALDFGNFIAHLVLRKFQSPSSSSVVDEGMKAFVAAYGLPDQGFECRARWWQAATHLRQAALYLLRPKWRFLVSKLMREVARLSEDKKNR